MSEPTTFAEWYAKYDPKAKLNEYHLEAAWDAAVASQQALTEAAKARGKESERLWHEVSAQLADARADAEHWRNAARIVRAEQTDQLAKLSAVVSAARAYVNRIEAEAAAVEPWNAPEIDYGIQRAVAELDRLTGERQ